MGELTLKIVSPTGAHEAIKCDSVHLTVTDDAKGKGGGSYGIRSHSVKAMYSLDKGEIIAISSGERIFTAECGCGFAAVENGTVTAVVESYNVK